MRLDTWPKLNGMNPIGESESRDLSKIRMILARQHRLETLERFKWTNLPNGITADIIERTLYFRGKGGFFKFNEQYFFMPFTLESKHGIDSNGRYNWGVPVAWNGTVKDGKFKDEPFVMGLDLKYPIAYDKEQELTDPMIILTDSSLSISQDIYPMNELITPLLDQMVDILVLINIDLVTSAKVFYVRVPDESTKQAVEAEYAGLDNKILNGTRVIAVVGDLDWQELQKQSPKDSARYFQSYQSFDNLRKTVIGNDNGGTFLKQEHQTDSEMQTNSSTASLVKKNALRMRTEWKDLVNHFYGFNINVEEEASEQADIVGEESSQTEQLRGDENDV